MKYLKIISIAIIFILLIASVIFFPDAYVRIIESIRDLIYSIGIYFCEFFEIENSIPRTVHDLSIIDNTERFRYILDEFYIRLTMFFQLLINKYNLIAFGEYLLELLIRLSKWIVILAPFVAAIAILVTESAKRENHDFGKQSEFIPKFKKFEKVLHKIKLNINFVIDYYKENRIYLLFYILLVGFIFNFIQILIEFTAFYFVFVTEFNITVIPIQLYKLLIDLMTCIETLPGIIWLIIGILVFNLIRCSIARNKIRHKEAQNCGFINSLPIVFMLNGTMGKGKTTLMTDMSLSIEWMYKQKALDIMSENMSLFPNFQWIKLERFIRMKKESNEIYSLASSEAVINSLKEIYESDNSTSNLFDYDINLFPLEINNGIKKISIWDSILSYTKAFIIYQQPSPLLISNYSIRSAVIQDDDGNLPTLRNDIMKPDNDKYSHIIDYDMTRLGNVIDFENPKKDMFEYGIVSLTEIGKERGNQVELQSVKKSDWQTNQKNDGFNKWIKMVRHSATVDNFPFVRVLFDEQRPESLSADVRELCDLVTINELSDTDILLPFYALEELLHNIFYKKYIDFYNQYRMNRGDETFFLYISKKIISAMHRRNTKIYNLYGFRKAKLQTESGTMEGGYIENNYFVIFRKIYASRFTTDCYSDFFAKKNSRTNLSMDKLESYGTIKATTDELNMQHSYFINEISNIGEEDESF